MSMTRLSHPCLFGLGLLLAAPVLAAPPDSPAPVTATAPDKVYPPLPSLAMLPPGGGAEIEPVARTRGGKRKTAAVAPMRKPAEPVPHMVVSEASRTYLAGIERQLETALQK